MAKKRKKPTIKRRNVAAGFMDEDGVFHPIRASYDYSKSRAGEGGSRRRAPKRGAKKRNPTMRANPTRVKGAKVAGGRAVSLRNFTGRVIRKRDGTVQILGRMQKTK